MQAHRTLIFFVLDGAVTFVPQPQYARLLRGEWRLPEHAERTVRVADWYVAAGSTGEPKPVNETYSILQFDAHGRVDWRRCRIGGTRNQALYEALRNSTFDDPDDDPAVQRLRSELCDEVSWLPDREERKRLEAAAEQARSFSGE